MNRTRWMIPSIQPSSLAGWLSLPGSPRIHCKKSMHKSCSGSNKIVHRCRCEAKIYLFSDFDVSLCCVSLHNLFFVFFPHSCTTHHCILFLFPSLSNRDPIKCGLTIVCMLRITDAFISCNSNGIVVSCPSLNISTTIAAATTAIAAPQILLYNPHNRIILCACLSLN